MKVVRIFGFIALVVVLCFLFLGRTRKRELDLPGGISWSLSADDPNVSRLMLGTNELISGMIKLKGERPYIYGLCSGRVFILDVRCPQHGVKYEEDTFDIGRKYGFDANLQGIRTFYDYKQEGDTVDFAR